MIVGILGKAGSGKDTVADILVKEYKFVKISLADPLKRFCMDAFEFSEQQLWGPSEFRNKPDERFFRGKASPVKPLYLTPRYALQIIGTEGGRHCYENVWIDYAVRIAKKIESGQYEYDKKIGTYPTAFASAGRDVVIPDVRFKNEIEVLKKHGIVVKLKREVAGLEGEAAQHQSEAEQDEIADDNVDAIIDNNSTLENLYTNVRNFLSNLNYKGRQVPPLE